MNANSKQPAPTIDQWLRDAATQLKDAGIPTARLDAELILSHVLEKPRTWLIAHSNEPVSDSSLLEGSAFPAERRDTNTPLERSVPEKSELSETERADALLSQRVNRIPLAYLTDHKEFYGRNFTVTPNVLIPRPETEEMIEQLKLLDPKSGQNLIDVGTGSGVIAITADLEFPRLHVEAVDISPEALDSARQNANSLQADIDFYRSDLLASAKHSYNFILANLPYVDRIWERSTETDQEPALALFADDKGLALIKQCMIQARERLKTNGYLLLEADPRQFDEIIAYAIQHGFELVRVNGYAMTLRR